MSMAVDLSTPMTDAEYAYLQSRSQTARIEQMHQMHGTSDADYAHVDLGSPQPGPKEQVLLQGDARARRREQLLEELAALSGDEGDDEEDGEVVEDDRPYAEWSVAELDAELKVRELPTTGKQADKVKRLEDNDAANA
jgi:hypothetical protein